MIRSQNNRNRTRSSMAAWVVILSLVFVGSSVKASWRCLDGRLCAPDHSHELNVTRSVDGQVLMAEATCVRCHSGIKSVSGRSSGSATLRTLDSHCLLSADDDRPALSASRTGIESSPSIVPGADRFATNELQRSTISASDSIDPPPPFWRPALGRAPPPSPTDRT